MKSIMKTLATMMGAALLFAASSAFALTFSVNGTSVQNSPAPQDAIAEISFSPLVGGQTTMTIGLGNTAATINQIASALDGFSFTFSIAPTSITLTNVAPSSYGTLSLNSHATTLTSPYAWTVNSTGSFSINNGGGTISPTLSNPFLVAGSGSYHPYEIVNNNIVNPNGSLTDKPHNPLFLSDATHLVDFTFILTGLDAIPNITDAKFYFGTGGETQTTVPEPGTLLLLGGGLIGLGYFGRRRMKK